MSALSTQARIALLREALKGLSVSESECIVREVFGKTSDTFDPFETRCPNEHLNWQISQAIQRDIHHLYNMGKDEFREFLSPLEDKLDDLKEVKAPAVPFLLVFPAGSLVCQKKIKQRRRFLVNNLRYDGQCINTECNLEAFEDTVEVSNKPYLAVSVELGKELACLSAEDSDESVDPAGEHLKSEGRFPLTLDEGIIFSCVFENWLVGKLPGFRILGTRYCSSDCPIIEMSKRSGPLEIDNMSPEIISDEDDWYKVPYAVPSCLERITF